MEAARGLKPDLRVNRSSGGSKETQYTQSQPPAQPRQKVAFVVEQEPHSSADRLLVPIGHISKLSAESISKKLSKPKESTDPEQIQKVFEEEDRLQLPIELVQPNQVETPQACSIKSQPAQSPSLSAHCYSSIAGLEGLKTSKRIFLGSKSAQSSDIRPMSLRNIALQQPIVQEQDPHHEANFLISKPEVSMLFISFGVLIGESKIRGSSLEKRSPFTSSNKLGSSSVDFSPKLGLQLHPYREVRLKLSTDMKLATKHSRNLLAPPVASNRSSVQTEIAACRIRLTKVENLPC